MAASFFGKLKTKASAVKEKVTKAGQSFLSEHVEKKSIKVGVHRFKIKNKIAEGGFGYVYLAEPENGTGVVAIKHMVMPTAEHLRSGKRELEVFRLLGANRHIVRLIDAELFQGKQHPEAYVAMEYCSRGSLAEEINSRVPAHLPGLAERQIWDIFYQLCEAVALMHSQSPPIVHRDLKAENVLGGSDGLYKLCDFGSATFGSVLADTEKGRLLTEEEINRYTTMCYRAPEMVDLYQDKVIGEKADVWALGCLLYKMAYLVTPFEEGGRLGILNAKIDFPPSPNHYSAELHALIRQMLEVDPDKRIDVFEAFRFAAERRGVAATHPLMKRPPASPPRIFSIEEGSPSDAALALTGQAKAQQQTPRSKGHAQPRTPAPGPSPGKAQFLSALDWSAPVGGPETAGGAATSFPPLVDFGTAPASWDNASAQFDQKPAHFETSWDDPTPNAPSFASSNKPPTQLTGDGSTPTPGPAQNSAPAHLAPLHAPSDGHHNRVHHHLSQGHHGHNHAQAPAVGQGFLAPQGPVPRKHRRSVSASDAEAARSSVPYAPTPIAAGAHYGQGLVVPDARRSPSPGDFSPGHRRSLSDTTEKDSPAGPGLGALPLAKLLAWPKLFAPDLPDARALRKLILESWRDGSGHGALLASVFTADGVLRNLQDPMLAIRVFSVLLRLLQEGSPAMLTELNRRSGAVRDSATFWLRAAQTSGQTLPSCAAAVAQYLSRRLEFHSIAPEFEGSFSLDVYFKSLRLQGLKLKIGGNSSPIRRQVLGLVQDLQEVVEELGANVFKMADRSVWAWLLTPLLNDSYSLLLVTHYCATKLLATKSDLSKQVSQYEAQHGKLLDLFAQARQVLARSLAHLPALTATPAQVDPSAVLALPPSQQPGLTEEDSVPNVLIADPFTASVSSDAELRGVYQSIFHTASIAPAPFPTEGKASPLATSTVLSQSGEFPMPGQSPPNSAAVLAPAPVSATPPLAAQVAAPPSPQLGRAVSPALVPATSTPPFGFGTPVAFPAASGLASAFPTDDFFSAWTPASSSSNSSDPFGSSSSDPFGSDPFGTPPLVEPATQARATPPIVFATPAPVAEPSQPSGGGGGGGIHLSLNLKKANNASGRNSDPRPSQPSGVAIPALQPPPQSPRHRNQNPNPTLTQQPVSNFPSLSDQSPTNRGSAERHSAERHGSAERPDRGDSGGVGFQGFTPASVGGGGVLTSEQKLKDTKGNAENAAILKQLSSFRDNALCFDCLDKSPQWASINLGVFICYRCSGVHRSLGTHITQVRSVTLDSWTPKQIHTMQGIGNAFARQVWEAFLDSDYRRPDKHTDQTELERFIRSKYQYEEWKATGDALARFERRIENRIAAAASGNDPSQL